MPANNICELTHAKSPYRDLTHTRIGHQCFFLDQQPNLSTNEELSNHAYHKLSISNYCLKYGLTIVIVRERYNCQTLNQHTQ